MSAGMNAYDELMISCDAPFCTEWVSFGRIFEDAMARAAASKSYGWSFDVLEQDYCPIHTAS